MDNVLYSVWNDPVLTTAVFLLAFRICCIRTLCARRQIICVHANDQSFKGPHSSRDCCYCSGRYVGPVEIGEIEAYERQDLNRIKICSVLVKLTATELWLVQRLGYVKVLTSPSDLEL